jgi:FkbM family methyltransferase
MYLVKKILLKPFENIITQAILEWNVSNSLALMGIGTGGDVLLSGEKAVFSLIKRKIPAPYCFFDVGANQGQYLKLLLDNFKSQDATIHCFEPGLKTYNALLDNAKNAQNVKLNNFGIGREVGEALLHYDQAGSGLASLTRRRLDHFEIDFNQSEKISIDTIDNYCTTNQINHINLLKLDIEGHELDALIGASNMLRNNAIDVITFEFGGCNIDTKSFFQDFWYFFQAAKMDIFRIVPAGYLFKIISYREIYEQFKTTNFVAVSQRLKR